MAHFLDTTEVTRSCESKNESLPLQVSLLNSKCCVLSMETKGSSSGRSSRWMRAIASEPYNNILMLIDIRKGVLAEIFRSCNDRCSQTRDRGRADYLEYLRQIGQTRNRKFRRRNVDLRIKIKINSMSRPSASISLIHFSPRKARLVYTYTYSYCLIEFL